ncbi:MAG: hypothetical protein EB089_04285, partial [Acidimicrobiia bacterium]|nr:hypothetical protein [Acidimicrobiia bacterium]
LFTVEVVVCKTDEDEDVVGVYSGLMIRNINGWGEKRCSNWFSCSGGADKSNSLTVLPVRAYTP